MTAETDRVSQLLEGPRRSTRAVVTPEGIVLDVEIADHGERLAAFGLDFLFWLGTTLLLYAIIAVAALHGVTSTVASTIILFIAFLIRNLYFVYFELVWQGATPGKRICGLRVIDRQGGPLTASALVARNLTREVEVFLPLGLFLTLSIAGGGFWTQLAYLAWAVLISAVPFFNREHLRVGDLIGGTMVIAMPRRALLADLAQDAQPYYAFTRAQLAAYGAFELQVLEELLRQPDTADKNRLLADVCAKICRKIGWTDPIPPASVPYFLQAFYTAERAELERARLFGRHRADKNAAAGRPRD